MDPSTLADDTDASAMSEEESDHTALQSEESILPRLKSLLAFVNDKLTTDV